jgi:hypothetical protein
MHSLLLCNQVSAERSTLHSRSCRSAHSANMSRRLTPGATLTKGLMPVFCLNWAGKPEPLEGQQLAWVRKERLRNYPCPPRTGRSSRSFRGLALRKGASYQPSAHITRPSRLNRTRATACFMICSRRWLRLLSFLDPFLNFWTIFSLALCVGLA